MPKSNDNKLSPSDAIRKAAKDTYQAPIMDMAEIFIQTADRMLADFNVMWQRIALVETEISLLKQAQEESAYKLVDVDGDGEPDIAVKPVAKKKKATKKKAKDLPDKD